MASAVLAELPAAAPGTRLSLSWGEHSHELRVTGAAPGAAAQLHVVRWCVRSRSLRRPASERFARGRGLSGVEQQRVAHDSLPLFTALQARRRTEAPHDWWLAVRGYSRAVCAVLGRSEAAATLESLAEAALGPQAVSLAAWELLEACFVDQARLSGSVGEALAGWLGRNHTAVCAEGGGELPPLGDLLRRLLPACASCARPEELPDFWAACARLAALGLNSCCVELLQRHSVWADVRLRRPSAQPLAAALDAVEKLLLHAPHGGGPQAEAHAAAWRAAVAATLARQELWAQLASTPSGEGARAVVRILAGEQEAVAAATGHWCAHTRPVISHPPADAAPARLSAQARAVRGAAAARAPGPLRPT